MALSLAIKVTLDEFMEGCTNGLFQKHVSNPGDIGGGQDAGTAYQAMTAFALAMRV
jgi:hypothetical protein